MLYKKFLYRIIAFMIVKMINIISKIIIMVKIRKYLLTNKLIRALVMKISQMTYQV